MAITTLLVIIVILLLILVFAIEPARQLFRSLGSLIIAGVLVITSLTIFAITIYFVWNVLENASISQVFWWVELFIAISLVTIGVGNLSLNTLMFVRLFIMTKKSKSELEFSSLDKLGAPWLLSFFAIPLFTFFAGSGILIYQISNSWKSLKGVDSIYETSNSFVSISILNSFPEYIPLWIGVIFLGAIFFLGYCAVVWVQYNIVEKLSGKNIIPPRDPPKI